MKLFGYYLVKTKTLRAHEEALSELIEHFNNNGGFMNEKGTFESDGQNKTIAEHWSRYHQLVRKALKPLTGAK